MFLEQARSRLADIVMVMISKEDKRCKKNSNELLTLQKWTGIRYNICHNLFWIDLELGRTHEDGYNSGE